MGPPSAEAEQLRALAVRWARVHLPGLDVAVIGSAGRGDAAPGSDLDLWALGGSAREVWQAEAEGIPLTVFQEPLALAQDPDHLAHVETGWAVPVLGRAAPFEAASALALAHAPRLRAQREEAIHASTAALLLRARTGSPEGRLWSAREAARRAACFAVFRKAQLLAPKTRHFRAHLEHSAVQALEGVLGAGAVARMTTAAQVAARVTEATAGLDEERRARTGLPPAPRPPASAWRKWAAGEAEDAVMALRRWLHEAWLLPLQEASPGMNQVAYLRGHAPAQLAALWDLLHGHLPHPSSADADAVEARAGQLVASLLA